jgi:O-antigen/teichoic acid export membrane protein
MPTIPRSAASTVGQVLASALILLVLYRAILDILGAEYLGIWSVTLAVVSASAIGDFGLSASVTRFVAKYRGQADDQSVGLVIQTAVVSVAILLLFVLVAAYPWLALLFEWLFEGEELSEALILLPYVALSFWLTVVAAVFQSGLDGCQRYDLRALLVVGGQALFLCGALLLTPTFGLLGLAWAQIAQGLLLVIVGWLLLHRLVARLPKIPYVWRRATFREMLNYGIQFQVGSIAMMLFTPVTKVLIGRYGGMSDAGYYEMASQFVRKARSLIVSANQVVVPFIARLEEDSSRRQLSSLYHDNMRVMMFIVLPLYGLVAASAPITSELWIGRYEPMFAFSVGVLALAWGVNTFAIPSYFANMGTGRLAWNTFGHVWIGLTNVGLGIGLGLLFGPRGVVWGMVVALISGSAMMIAAYHHREGVAWKLSMPNEGIWIIGASLLVGGGGFHTYHALADQSLMVRAAVCLLLPISILGPTLWWHPLRAPLLRQIRNAVRGFGSAM